jgi:cysteine desulfurase
MNASGFPKHGHDDSTIYLDYHASTPIDMRVLEIMQPYLMAEFGNPHSASHAFGRRAALAVERAREQVAALIDGTPEDIVFTSGATEANNLALQGLAGGWGTGRPRFLVSSIEHASVLEPVAMLAQAGFDVVHLRVSPDGLVDLDQLELELRRGPSLVSIGAANGEVGTIQAMRRVADLCREADAMLHTDATQAVGKMPISFYDDGIDLLTLASHKIYGPKGIGALVAAPHARRHLKPLIVGGGQQGGLRAGTLPTALCVGLGAACEVAGACWKEEATRLATYRDGLMARLFASTSGVTVNGTMVHRLPGNLNLRVKGVDGLQLIASLREVAISVGSACASAGSHVTPSHVLTALGLSDEEARSSIRISLGRFTSEEDCVVAADALARAIALVRVTDS